MSFTCSLQIPDSKLSAQEQVAKKYGWDDVYAGKPVGAPWSNEGASVWSFSGIASSSRF